MRKPLVVVCVVTSVALIAGGIAATAAGAETTPGEPALPGLHMPDLTEFPGFPQLPADPGTPAGPDDQAPSNAHAAPGGAAGPHGADGTQADGASQPGGAAQPAGATRPGGAVRPGAPDRVDDHSPATGDPDDAGRGDGQQQPAFQPPVAQRPAASTVAASHQEVTAGSVSTSPGAPVQQQVLTLVNGNRKRGGCDELSLDRRLIFAAQRHAADMAQRDYFAHESRNGDGAGDRVSDSGYRWRRYGENIARGADSAYEVVDGWMNSPVHRENIMDCQLEQMGIGLAFDSDRTPYWVQDFATPMP